MPGTFFGEKKEPDIVFSSRKFNGPRNVSSVSLRDAVSNKKAGDGARTHDIHVGNVTLYH